MANPLYMFGSYDFADDAEKLSWDYAINAPTYVLGREDGSRHGGATISSKTIRLEGLINAADYSAWRDKKDALMQGLFPTPRIQKLSLSDDRSYWAEVVAVSVPEWIGLPEMPFSVTFLCHDPFEYSNVSISNSWTDAATNVLQNYSGFGAPTTYSHTTFLFHNPGLMVWPKITFGWKAMTQPISLISHWGNLLRTSNFAVDTDGNGVADNWDKAGTGSCRLDPTTTVFGGYSQAIINSVVQETYVSQPIITGPALQGEYVTASAYIRREAGTAGAVRQQINQYSLDGTLLSTTAGSSLTAATGFTRDFFTVQLAQNCYHIKYALINGSDCKANFDGAMVEIGSSPSIWQVGIRKQLIIYDSLTVNDIYNIDCEARTVKKNLANNMEFMVGEFFAFESGFNLLQLHDAAPGVSDLWFQGIFVPRYL